MSPWSQLNIGATCALILFYALVTGVPARWWHRRQSTRMLAAGFGLVQICNLATCLANRTSELTVLETSLFGVYLVAQALVPVVVFAALLQDTRFWSGQGEWQRKVSSLRVPLMSPLRYTTAQHLSSVVESVSSVLLNFSFLDVDTSAVLGQGSSSKVYQGL